MIPLPTRKGGNYNDVLPFNSLPDNLQIQIHLVYSVLQHWCWITTIIVLLTLKLNHITVTQATRRLVMTKWNSEGGYKLRSGFKRLWTKVHEIWDNVGDPSYFSTPLPDCLCYVSFSRCSPLSIQVVWKPNKCKKIGPYFFQGDDTNFSPVDCYRDLPSTVWQSVLEFRLLISVCEAWQWCGKHKNNNNNWVKMAVKFEAVCGPKFVLFWDSVGDAL